MPTFPLEVVFFTLTAPLSSNSDIKTVLTLPSLIKLQKEHGTKKPGHEEVINMCFIILLGFQGSFVTAAKPKYTLTILLS